MKVTKKFLSPIVTVPSTVSQEEHFTPDKLMTALGRKLGLPIPQLLTAVGVRLSNNTNIAKKVGDAFGHAYTPVTGAKGDHIRTYNGAISDYLCDGSAGIPLVGCYENICKKHIRALHSPKPHV